MIEVPDSAPFALSGGCSSEPHLRSTPQGTQQGAPWTPATYTPSSTTACLPGPRYWRQRPIIADRYALWQARGRFGGVVIWGSNLRDAQLKFHNNDVCARWLLYPQLLDANLIDRLLLLTVPIVLGRAKGSLATPATKSPRNQRKSEGHPPGPPHPNTRL